MSRATQKSRKIGKTKCLQRIPYASLMLWLLLPACLWAQVQPSRQPVGSDLLRGGQLIVESRNFAVATPAGDWQWSVVENPGAAPSQSTYVCTETASGAELFVTVMDARMSSGSKFVAGFENGLKESLTASGLTVVSMDTAESSIPLPGSYHCRWRVQRRDGMAVYGYSYVTGGAATYVLQHATTGTSEPPEFTQFARTFRLLHPSRPGLQTRPGLVGIGYLLLVGLAWEAARIVNRVRGRVVLNGGTLGAAIVIVIMVVLIVIGNYAGLSAGLPSQTLGGITGYRIGEALIPLLVAVLVSRSFRKQTIRQEARQQDAEAGAGEGVRVD